MMLGCSRSFIHGYTTWYLDTFKYANFWRINAVAGVIFVKCDKIIMWMGAIWPVWAFGRSLLKGAVTWGIYAKCSCKSGSIYAEDPSPGKPVIVAGTMVRALAGHKALVRAWMVDTMAAINPAGGACQSPPLRSNPWATKGYQGAPEV